MCRLFGISAHFWFPASFRRCAFILAWNGNIMDAIVTRTKWPSAVSLITSSPPSSGYWFKLHLSSLDFNSFKISCWGCTWFGAQTAFDGVLCYRFDPPLAGDAYVDAGMVRAKWFPAGAWGTLAPPWTACVGGYRFHLRVIPALFSLSPQFHSPEHSKTYDKWRAEYF